MMCYFELSHFINLMKIKRETTPNHYIIKFKYGFIFTFIGPTDLSMKKQSSKSQLSAGEIATIKQLIGGYRESAAFLYRSADELEQLLLQQN